MNLIRLFDSYNPFKKTLSIDFPTDYVCQGYVIPVVAIPVPVVPQYILSKDICFGNRNDDVRKLQEELIYLGLLKSGLNTSYYGELTRIAVKAFLIKYKITSSFFIYLNAGKYCGPLMRKSLNSMFV